MKILTVIGARPQFIKASVVSREFAQQGVVEEIVHTGQHFDANMSDVFFEELEIPRPTHHLGIGGGTHGQNTGRMIEAIEKPAKTQETSPARFSRGASWAAKIKTREMIAPDTLAVKIRDKSSDQKPPASAVQVLPTKKMAM